MKSIETRVPGLVLVDHEIAVPLNHDEPNGPTITLFAREVARPDGRTRPFLVFLQGGPGGESPRPTGDPASPSWLARALQDFRVLFLDQRGTGQSTPFGPHSLRDESGSERPAADVAEYLTHFRCDAIVRDCELLREALNVETWSLLGQSFGGFTSVHYLSVAPQSLASVYITGGLVPVDRTAEDIYATTFDLMRDRSEEYYFRFPSDRARVREISELCARGEVVLPSGDVMTPQWFRTIGHRLGSRPGMEEVHYLLWRDPRSPAFAHDLRAMLPFGGRGPLYYVLHESSMADGVVTGWAADRVQPDDFAEDMTLLTGEHVYPWLAEVDSELRPYREVADALAEHPWPKLYFPEKLAECDVPVAASVYTRDVYVPLEHSLETAAMIRGCRPWVTSEFEHNGLRSHGDRILDRLIGLAAGEVF